MILSLILALSAASAVESRPASTNLSGLRDAPTVATTNSSADARVEQEFAALIKADEAAEAEMGRWLEAEGQNTNQTARAALERRIKERAEPIRRGYEEFLNRHPRHVQALLAYGSFLHAREEEAAAQSQWEKVLEMEPRNAEAHHDLACCYTERGQVKKAFDFFAKAIELDPSQAGFYYNFANTLYVLKPQGMTHYKLNEQQFFAKILQLYSESMRLDPSNLAYATDKAQTYYAMRPFPAEDALQAWTDTLSRARTPLEREEVWVHLARVKMLAGKLNEARSQLNLVTNAALSERKASLLRAIASREGENKEEKVGVPAGSATGPQQNR